MGLKHAQAEEIVDISPLGTRIAEARTQAIVKSHTFEAIRLIVPEGTLLPAHKVPGQITLHCLEGLVEIGLELPTRTLAANQWIYLDGGQVHSVKGLQDSSLLLTIILAR